MSKKRKQSVARKASERIDNLVGIFSPKTAFSRKQYRFAYDAIDNSRTRKKRSDTDGTGDRQLTEQRLWKLRGICREMGRNNPLVKGLLKIERNGVIGSGVKIQARAGDDKLNADIEASWKEFMVDRPCDVTGRYNINKYIGMQYLSYRRDGDLFTIFTDEGLQAVEGEQVGTPFGRKEAKHFDVYNGIAVSKKTKRVMGYYIGTPDKYGFIKSGSYGRYKAKHVHQMFNVDRFSQSRGEPVLTSAINFIDNLCDYIDAELVAAKVNACFSMFISRKDDMGTPDGYTAGISGTGEDVDGNRLEKLQPGTIMYGEDGESATGIGQTRPGSLFDPFVTKMLMLIGRPMCMPLMLVTMDFSGATFMNARIAYQKAQENWQQEQDWIVKPFISRAWRWHLQKMIAAGEFKDKKNLFAHEIICNRWPYVDPWKEAKADEQQLKNKTTTRTAICARQGTEFADVNTRLGEENNMMKEAGTVIENKEGNNNE